MPKKKNTTNVLRLFFLLLPLCCASASSLILNLAHTNIVSSSDQFRIRFAIEGGSPPYQINFLNPPSTCIVTETYLFFPKGQPSQYLQIPLRVRVQDYSANFLEATVIIITNGLNLFIDNTLYPLQIDFGKSLEIPPGQLTTKVQQIVLNARKQFYRPYQTIDDIFSDLPKVKELDEMINTKNMVGLYKAISSAERKANVNCIQKMSYLSQLASRIYQIRFKYQQDLRRGVFQEERQAQEGSPNKAQQIQNLKVEKIIIYQSLLSKYQKGSQTYNFYFLAFEAKLEEIVELKRQISVLFDQYDEVKQKSDLVRFQLSGKLSPEAKTELEILFKDYEQQKVDIYKAIEDLNQEIDENQKAVTILQDKADPIKEAISILEVDLEALQQEISQLGKEHAQIMGLNQQESEIQINLKKSEIESNLRILDETIPIVQQIIDRQYYKCYGIQNSYRNIRPDLSVNSITPTQFLNYVKNVYKMSISDSYFPKTPSKTVQLTNTNVLSTIWTENFGSALSSDSQALLNTFSCMSPDETLFTQNSYVREVKGNIFQVVTPDSGVQYLLLGACTRIQVTQSLPKTGSIIFWRGIVNQKNIYDVYFMLVL